MIVIPLRMYILIDYKFSFTETKGCLEGRNQSINWWKNLKQWGTQTTHKQRSDVCDKCLKAAVSFLLLTVLRVKSRPQTETGTHVAPWLINFHLYSLYSLPFTTMTSGNPAENQSALPSACKSPLTLGYTGLTSRSLCEAMFCLAFMSSETKNSVAETSASYCCCYLNWAPVFGLNVANPFFNHFLSETTTYSTFEMLWTAWTLVNPQHEQATDPSHSWQSSKNTDSYDCIQKVSVKREKHAHF